MRRAVAEITKRADDPEAAREAALKLLERTRRTRSDVGTRLRDRGFTPAVIEEVLERLSGVGLLDDVEYARAFLAGRWSRRMSGWRTLERELRRRGVGAEDVAAARTRLEEERGSIDEVAAARRVMTQVARRYDELEPRVKRQRLYALLARRGFDGETIQQAMNAPLEEEA